MNPKSLQSQVDRFKAIISQITTERSRQDAKWGEQNHDFPVWLAILMEEIGEASQAYLKLNFALVEAEGAAREGKAPDIITLAERGEMFRKELEQSTSVLVAMLECGDRNAWFGRVSTERRKGQERRQNDGRRIGNTGNPEAPFTERRVAKRNYGLVGRRDATVLERRKS